MAKYKLYRGSQEANRERANVVRGAKGHIKSILVALARYKAGSSAEKGYALEHLQSLAYYLQKL